MIVKQLEYPKPKGIEIIALLNRQEEFRVMEKLVQGETVAAYVLCESSWSWGHFHKAAFCSLLPSGSNSLVLSIVHLNVQKAWHGINLFRSADRKIEDHIYEYLRDHLPGGNSP
jgi:hypothetical protein